MTQFSYLFDNIEYFYAVYFLVTINTILAVNKSVKRKTFDWNKLTDVLQLMLQYSGYLIAGNIVDFFSKGKLGAIQLEGITLDMGFIFAIGLIASREIGKIRDKMKKDKLITSE